MRARALKIRRPNYVSRVCVYRCYAGYLFQIKHAFPIATQSVYELATDPTPYHWQCSAPHPDNSTYYGRTEFRAVYAYHALKVLDLLDTVFFVLRKKTAQLSFLHVYHHLAVVWGTWLTVNFYPGGHFAFLGLLNAGVHAVMYAYYFAVAWRPERMRQAVRVKKLVTLTQMAQFGALIVHSGWPLVRGSSRAGEQCETHKFLLALCTVQNAFLMCMFGEFYVRTYCGGRATTQPAIVTKIDVGQQRASD